MTRTFATLQPSEAMACYHALAQWAENTRIGVDEQDDPSPADVAQLAAVEAVVERLETVLAGLAGGVS